MPLNPKTVKQTLAEANAKIETSAPNSHQPKAQFRRRVSWTSVISGSLKKAAFPERFMRRSGCSNSGLILQSRFRRNPLGKNFATPHRHGNTPLCDQRRSPLIGDIAIDVPKTRRVRSRFGNLAGSLISSRAFGPNAPELYREASSLPITRNRRDWPPLA
jgi:hypothetical protein